jgi:hypothetical protein
MAQFNFYAAPGDRECLFQVLFGSGRFEIVPDLRYRKPSVQIYRQQPGVEFRSALKQTLHLYIRGEFSKHPLRLVKAEKDVYSIDPDRSGAMLDLSMPGVEFTEVGLLLRPGNLGYPRKIWDPTLTLAQPPPEPVKQVFRGLVAALKSSCLSRQTMRMQLWVGRNALELLKTGNTKILVLGKWWKYEDGKLRLDSRKGF